MWARPARSSSARGEGRAASSAGRTAAASASSGREARASAQADAVMPHGATAGRAMRSRGKQALGIAICISRDLKHT
eukprot:scaffold33467_cov129-Isochrysis_galbana.AAC.3